MLLIALAILAASATVKSIAAGQATVDHKITQLPIGSPHIAPLAESCPFQIIFGSHAAGIDGRVYREITALLARDSTVTEIILWPWGMEGERTLCLPSLTDIDSERLFISLRHIIPAESQRAWTLVRFEGRTFTTRWPD